MTIKLFYAPPGRRFLACVIASTLFASSIGFTGSATASERKTLHSHDDRSTLHRRSALASQRTANTPRSRGNTSREPGRGSGNNERDPAPDTIIDTAENLSWSAPMTRENGSKLYPGEIEGYRIYYRKPGQKKFRRIEVTDGSLTSFQLNRFKSGNYEFSVTTMDTNGLESRRSPVISASL